MKENQTDFIFTDSQVEDLAGEANASLGPLETVIREFLEEDELERVLFLLAQRRGHIVSKLMARERPGPEARSFVWKAADGCFEGVAVDMNTGAVSRRRYATPPPLNEVSDEELIGEDNPFRYRRFV